MDITDILRLSSSDHDLLTMMLQMDHDPSPAAATAPPPPFHNDEPLLSMREAVFRVAAMQPVEIEREALKPRRRRNVRISKDPQSVAARHRRERISDRIRVLRRLVPGGARMDTASMLDEAVHYVNFLKKQVRSLQQVGANRSVPNVKGYCQPPTCYSSHLMVGAMLQQQMLRS